MPRQARLDAPATLHHVKLRGIERTTVFRDHADRTDFVARLAAQGALEAFSPAHCAEGLPLPSSFRRKPESSGLEVLDPGFRRGDKLGCHPNSGDTILNA